MTAHTAPAPAARPAPPKGAWLKLSAVLAGQVPAIIMQHALRRIVGEDTDPAGTCADRPHGTRGEHTSGPETGTAPAEEECAGLRPGVLGLRGVGQSAGA